MSNPKKQQNDLEKIRHSLAHLLAMVVLDYVADKRGLDAKEYPDVNRGTWMEPRSIKTPSQEFALANF